MNSRSYASLLVEILILPFILLFAFPASYLLAQPPSPVELHRSLLPAFAEGHGVSDRVREYREATGDHSFDSLAHYTRAKARGARTELEARRLWLSNKQEPATEFYRRAAKELQEAGAHHEAAFCLYFAAEVLSEQERYEEALAVLETGYPPSSDSISLSALWAESRGYALWYLDLLPASAQAFGIAAASWSRLGYADGMVGAWNNIAALYEEMGLWDRSLDCYSKALSSIDSVGEPQVRFYLHLNYASLLLKAGRREEALRQAERAGQLRDISPGEMLVLDCRLSRTTRPLTEFASSHRLTPSLEIEQELLLGEISQSNEEALGSLQPRAGSEQ